LISLLLVTMLNRYWCRASKTHSSLSIQRQK